VLVTWPHGDPESEAGWYEPGGFAEGEIPDESAGDDYPQPVVFQWDTARLVVDEREGSPGLRLETTAGTELLTFDGKTGVVDLHGVTRLLLSSLGQVDIQGAVVTINGRPVRKAGGPI